MFQFISSFRKFFLSGIIVFALGTLVATYMLYIVPARESELNARGFRILSRIEKNTLDKKISYLATLDNIASRISRKERGAYLKAMDINAFDYIPTSSWVEQGEHQTSFIYNKYNEQWDLIFYGDSYFTIPCQDNLSSEVYLDACIEEDDYEILYKYDFSKFITPLVSYRKDFFKDYIILYNDTSVVYQSQKFIGGCNLKADSVLKKNIFSTGNVTDVVLSGENYKLFRHAFNHDSELKLTVCGLIPTDEYNRDKFLISSYTSFIVILSFLLALLLLPFVKIFTITRYERLMKTDIVIMLFCGAGAGIMIAILFGINILGGERKDWGDQNIKSLNDKVKQNFIKELETNVNTLNRIQKKDVNTTAFQDWYKKSIGKAFAQNSIPLYTDYASDSSHMDYLLLISPKGWVYAQWGIDSSYSMPWVPIFGRSYYQDIINPQKALWKIKDDVASPSFAFQAIYSYTNQKNSVVISMPPDTCMLQKLSGIEKELITQLNDSLCKAGKPWPDDSFGIRRPAVIAIQTDFSSVMSPVTYNEMGFCIIDEKGEVLFHSDQKRNLMENLLEECDYDEHLQSALRNRSSESIGLNFYGNDYETYITPIDNLPVYVVSFMDNTYRSDMMADTIAFTFTISSSILFTLLIFFLLYYLIIQRARYLIRESFDFHFLNYNLYNFYSAKRIMGFLFCNAVLFIPGMLLLEGFNLLFFIYFMALNVPVISGLISYKAIRNKYYAYPFKTKIYRKFYFLILVFSIAGFAFLLLLAYLIRNYYNVYQEYNINGIILLTVFALFYIGLFSALDYKQGLNRKNKFYRFVLLVCGISYFILNYVLKKARLVNKGTERIYNIRKQIALYPLIVLMFIINVSIIPALVLLNQSLNTEKTFTAKRRTLALAKDIIDRKNQFVNPLLKFRSSVPDIKNIGDTLLWQGVYAPAIINHKNNPSFPSENKYRDEEFNDFYIGLANLSRVNYHTDEIDRISMARNINKDQTWQWEDKNPDSYLYYNYPAVQDRTGDIETLQLNYNSSVLGRGRLQYFTSFCLTILFILSLVVIYFLFQYIYKKVTLSEYFFQSVIKVTDEYFITHLYRDAVNVLVIALPGSGVEDFIREDIQKNGFQKKYSSLSGFSKGDYEWYTQDKNTPGTTVAFENLIILKNLEFKAETDAALNEKLNHFDNLFKSQNTKIVWIAASDPSIQIETLRKNSIAAYSKIAKDANYKDIEAYHRQSHAYDKMLRILDDFNKVYYSLKEYKNNKPSAVELHIREKFPYLYSIINAELRFGNYLQQLRMIIFSSEKTSAYPYALNLHAYPGSEYQLFRDTPNINEEIILKIQDIASNYYLSVWNSLSSVEKYILFDMAVDNMTNYHNLSILVTLKEKGLLIYDDREKCLQIFNKSFRNFILTRVDAAEAETLKKDVHSPGTWQITKTIIVLLLLALGTFIFFTQQSIFQRLLVLITTVSSIIPMLFKIAGTVSDKKA